MGNMSWSNDQCLFHYKSKSKTVGQHYFLYPLEFVQYPLYNLRKHTRKYEVEKISVSCR